MFMKRPTLKALAEQNGYSRRTLFRVLRGDPCVKPETREMLIRLLNIHGYTIENRTATEKSWLTSLSTTFTPRGLRTKF